MLTPIALALSFPLLSCEREDRTTGLNSVHQILTRCRLRVHGNPSRLIQCKTVVIELGISLIP